MGKLPVDGRLAATLRVGADVAPKESMPVPQAKLLTARRSLCRATENPVGAAVPTLVSSSLNKAYDIEPMPRVIDPDVDIHGAFLNGLLWKVGPLTRTLDAFTGCGAESPYSTSKQAN